MNMVEGELYIPLLIIIIILIGKNTILYIKRKGHLKANPKHTWSIQQALEGKKK